MEELLIKRKKPAKKKQHSARREAAETDNSQQSTDSGDATTASPSSAPTTSSTATQQQPTAPPLHSPLQLPQQTKWQQQQEETNLMDQAEAHIQPTISQLDLLRPQVNPDTVTSIYPEHIGDSSAITLPDTSTSAALVNIDKSEVLSMVSAPGMSLNFLRRHLFSHTNSLF